MNLFRAALLIARKDLLLYARDRTGLALGLVLPLVLVAVFSYVDKMMAGDGGGGAFSKAALWVADEDQSETSGRFIAALRDAKTINVKPETGKADAKPVTAAELRQKLHDGDLHHGLVIAKGFGETVARGELPQLRLMRDPDREVEEQLISIGLMQAVMATLGSDFAAPLTTRALEQAGLPKEWRDRTLALSKTFSSGIETLFKEKADTEKKAAPEAKTADSAGFDMTQIVGQLVPIEHEDFRPPERPKQLTYMLAHTVSGIGVMMLMFGLVACAGLLLREREGGTLPRLLLAPAPHAALLLGKFLFTALVGAAQLTLLFAFGAIVFHVDVLRDPVTFLAISLSVLVAVTAFGMLIGTWAKTQKQADGVSTLVILVMSALGGAWFPLQMLDLSPAVKMVMGCTLTHWAVSAYQALFWYGKGLTDKPILTSIAVLWGFAIVASFASHRLFKKRYVGG